MRKLLTQENEWWNTVLITTHDIPFAHVVRSKFFFMRDGKIIWEGKKDQFPTPDDLETHFLSSIGSVLRA